MFNSGSSVSVAAGSCVHCCLCFHKVNVVSGSWFEHAHNPTCAGTLFIFTFCCLTWSMKSPSWSPWKRLFSWTRATKMPTWTTLEDPGALAVWAGSQVKSSGEGLMKEGLKVLQLPAGAAILAGVRTCGFCSCVWSCGLVSDRHWQYSVVLKDD